MADRSIEGSWTATPLWQPVVFGAMAGGMGWGIRGQYGHETGAMIAGLLVSLTLVFLLCPRADARSVVRALAWGTVGMGFGGSMTYGQTVGLTHDAPLVGHFGALSWGMLGLAIKGGVWIGFGGVFLGMGLGGKRYRPREMLLLMLAMLGAFTLGVRLLNSPFYPASETLPLIYFSDHWRWEAGELSPRREVWGGLLLALTVAIFYAGYMRKDRLARNLALWGILGGAIGFPLGQSLQAFHVWNRELFAQGLWAQLDPHMNWWNMMETTFGAVMGGTLGLGLWLNRGSIRPRAAADEDRLSPGLEAVVLAVHIPMLIAVEFLAIRQIDILYDLGLMMGIIPIVAIAGGGSWPYLQILPITLIPIAGKTLRQLGYREEAIGPIAGWIVYVAVPMFIALAAANVLANRAQEGMTARAFTRRALLLATWMYFLLNFAFFHFPWPWEEWTGRTPNGVIFTVCALGLTAIALMKRSAPGAGAGTEALSEAMK